MQRTWVASLWFAHTCWQWRGPWASCLPARLDVAPEPPGESWEPEGGFSRLQSWPSRQSGPLSLLLRLSLTFHFISHTHTFARAYTHTRTRTRSHTHTHTQSSSKIQTSPSDWLSTLWQLFVLLFFCIWFHQVWLASMHTLALDHASESTAGLTGQDRAEHHRCRAPESKHNKHISKLSNEPMQRPAVHKCSCKHTHLHTHTHKENHYPKIYELTYGFHSQVTALLVWFTKEAIAEAPKWYPTGNQGS